MKRWNKERLCLTIRQVMPEPRTTQDPNMLLPEKLVGSVLCVLFTCWFVGFFGGFFPFLCV